jgi:RNA polymerase sigma-70 factor (ECF subfamily)
VTEEMDWINQSRQGNDEAFTHIVEVYQTPVYNLCYRMLGEVEAAEDAAQESFLRAYQNIHRYDPNRSFATWLLSISAHYCIDRLRRRRFSTVSIDDDDEEHPMELPDQSAVNPEAETARREEQEQLQKVLLSLNSIDRAAIVMRYWYDFSEVEIAESLSLTVSAVKSRLHRARRELAKHWQEEQPHSQLERSPHESPAF